MDGFTIGLGLGALVGGGIGWFGSSIHHLQQAIRDNETMMAMLNAAGKLGKKQGDIIGKAYLNSRALSSPHNPKEGEKL